MLSGREGRVQTQVNKVGLLREVGRVLRAEATSRSGRRALRTGPAGDGHREADCRE